MCCQVRAREEELLNLTSLHTATKAAADKRIAALEGRVTKLLDANRWGPWGAAAVEWGLNGAGLGQPCL